jgi:hypothetical protein
MVRRLRTANCETRIALLVALLVVATAVPARADYDGGSAGMFMDYGASPRTLAMGKAFCGLADDAEAAYFNPAGLVQLNSQNIKMAHSMLVESRMEYLAYAMPTRAYGSFGLTVLNFGSEGLDSRDKDNNKYGSSIYEENAVIFSYAYAPWHWLGAGANLKVVSKNLAEYSGLGPGADVGLIVTVPKPLSFGFYAQNVYAPSMKLRPDAQKETYPLVLRAGVAARLYNDRVAVDIDVDKVGYYKQPSLRAFFSTIEPHGGVEFQLVPDAFTLRTGVDMNEVSVGAGLKKVWGNFSLGVDYAFLMHYQSNYMLSPTHKLGLNIEFGGYRTWIQPFPSIFSPTPDDKRNVLWMDIKMMSRRKIKRWQILLKNNLGEVVRTFYGWDNPPLRMAWDGLDDAGRLVSDGSYFYEIVLVDERNESMEHGGALTRIKTKGPQGKVEVEQNRP